ncbi:hypothetical protein DE146DRAFT_636319 [Phaeosphaeria sp. MPI-PUGE-AT-0046c]|nr:hypothetical protein DE146DRAFT_636319 [Phaeosphaeria sp. MPI-PUGE-AT-0046c]
MPNYLCEQDQWHVACSDSHATAAAIIQRDEYLERRQLGQFFQSVGGAIASFFDPPPAPSAPPPPQGPPKPERTTTSQPPPSTKAAKSSAPATTLSPTTRTKTSVAPTKAASTSDQASSAPTSSDPVTSDPTPITSAISESISIGSATPAPPFSSNSALPASSPSATPSPSSGISGGAIAGIVIGILALLALLGALAVFLLRKKRKESNAEHLRALDDNGRQDSMDERLVKQPAVAVTPMASVAAAPMNISRRPVPGVAGAGSGAGYVQDEKKGVYRSDGHAGVELGTTFNAWELDSKEVPRPVVAELESPTTEARPPHGGVDARGTAASRREHNEMHF